MNNINKKSPTGRARDRQRQHNVHASVLEEVRNNPGSRPVPAAVLELARFTIHPVLRDMIYDIVYEIIYPIRRQIGGVDD